jgi:tetratricopeptide (TPR) repeat protein
VRSAGELLLHLPLSSKLESIADYYVALGLNRSTLGDGPRAGRLFERVAENSTPRYRGRALLALGSNHMMAGDLRTAVSLYQETMRIVTRDDAFDPVSFIVAARMTAVIKGMNGDHLGAIVDLEKLFPLARAAGSLRPHTYYDYLNTFSVELTEVGRLEQARRASEIALTSPFAPAYPEWQETFDEITVKQRHASHSTVGVSGFRAEPPDAQRSSGLSSGSRAGKRNKLFRFPIKEISATAEMGSASAEDSQGRVLNFQQWKSRVELDSAQLSALSSEQRLEMSTGEKLIRLMDLISHDDTDDETIDVILEAVEAIVLGRRGAS